MSEPSTQQLKADNKKRFVEEYWNSFTAEKKFDILQNGLGTSFVEGDFRDWLSEQKHD